MGSQGSDYDIWNHIAKSPQAKKLGLKIKVKQITDGVQLNNATAQGSVNVNAFQSYSYLEAYNKEHKTAQLAALGTTYLEPLGIYSDKYKKVTQIPSHATIAIANNPANTARGLLLLQSAGLIKLKKNFGTLGNTNDIVSNPKHLKFKQIDDTTGPRVLHNVDAVLISNTVALEGHLNVLKDSIFHEKKSILIPEVISTYWQLPRRTKVTQATKSWSNCTMNQQFKNTSRTNMPEQKSRCKSRFLIWNNDLDIKKTI